MKKATDLLYGEYQEDNNNFKSTIDIEGIYVNNWSSFKTQERILSYIIPGKIIKVSGSKGEFLLNGEKMNLIGDNMYSSPMGKLQFVERNGKLFIATESAVTYTRIHFWQNKTIQLFIPLIFAALSLVSFIKGIKIKRVVYIFVPLIRIIALAGICFFLYRE